MLIRKQYLDPPPCIQEVTLQLDVDGVEVAQRLASHAPWDLQTIENETVTPS